MRNLYFFFLSHEKSAKSLKVRRQPMASPKRFQMPHSLIEGMKLRLLCDVIIAFNIAGLWRQ